MIFINLLIDFVAMHQSSESPLSRVTNPGVYLTFWCFFLALLATLFSKANWCLSLSYRTIIGPSSAPLLPTFINFVHNLNYNYFQQKKYLFCIILGLGWVKTISGPSAAARKG